MAVGGAQSGRGGEGGSRPRPRAGRRGGGADLVQLADHPPLARGQRPRPSAPVTPLCFVTASAGNHFVTELLGAVASEAEALGAPVRQVADHFPSPEPGTAYVYVPHEFAAAAPPEAMPTAAQ